MDRSGPYKMNRGALVDSIITIEFNRWTGGPSYGEKKKLLLILQSQHNLFPTQIHNVLHNSVNKKRNIFSHN